LKRTHFSFTAGLAVAFAVTVAFVKQKGQTTSSLASIVSRFSQSRFFFSTFASALLAEI
jgi:hypothetical protein